ncbi:cytochrome c3 family protein, partial [Candidatus Riflebacteria bacterium]
TMSDMDAGKFCGKCHNGSNAFASASNCGKCHANLSSNGPEIVFKASGTPFSHKSHVDSFKLECSTCHGGDNDDSPWKMLYEDQKYTMAQMYVGQGCGSCHNSGGTAFDLSDTNRCVSCHSGDSHANVDAGSKDPAQCKTCHSTEYAEFITPSVGTNNHGYYHGKDFRRSNYGGQTYTPNGCSECHWDAAGSGKAVACSTPAAYDSTITCQTCHYPNDKDGGDVYPYRLRRDPDELCALCHHLRYTYGKNPLTAVDTIKEADWGNEPLVKYPLAVANNPLTWQVPAEEDPGWPTLLRATPLPVASDTSITAPCPPLVEYKYWMVDQATGLDDFMVNGETNATSGLRNLIQRGLLGGTLAEPSGGGYAHYSGQWDVLRGPLAGTFVIFEKDVAGNALTFGDSKLYNTDNACVKCHMVRGQAGTYGHTFEATDSAVQTVYGSAFDVPAAKAEIASLVHELELRLDVDGSGDVRWTRSGSNSTDIRAMTTKGLSNRTKMVMLAISWAYVGFEEDYSHGMHNFEFVRSTLTNYINIMDQLKTHPNSPDTGLIDWF